MTLTPKFAKIWRKFITIEFISFAALHWQSESAALVYFFCCQEHLWNINENETVLLKSMAFVGTVFFIHTLKS